MGTLGNIWLCYLGCVYLTVEQMRATPQFQASACNHAYTLKPLINTLINMRLFVTEFVELTMGSRQL